MIEPLSILRDNLEREKKVKALREINPRENETEISELLAKIRKNYRNLVVNHAPVLREEAKEVDALLWKGCFYRTIEDFRKSIRRYSAQIDAAYKEEGVSLAVEKQRIHLAKLTHGFISFLSDSISFYQKMMIELEEKANEALRKEQSIDCYIKSIYKCLLYLGDLARYRDLYAEKELKDYSESVRYYERASLICPFSGNAHNQLAVLATYSEFEAIAVYHYCRSVLIKEPFNSGFENLSVLFRKNVNLFNELQRVPPPRYLFDPTGSARLDRSRKAENLKIKNFLIKYVRLHGLLYHWTIDMHRDYVKSTPVASTDSNSTQTLPMFKAIPTGENGSTEENTLNIDLFEDLLRSTLDEFESVAGTGALVDSMLVRLLAIALFSVHFAVAKDRNILLTTAAADLSTSTANDPSSFPSTLSSWVSPASTQHTADGEAASDNAVAIPKLLHTVLESLALMTLFGLISRSATRINSVMENNDKGKRSTMNKILPMLSVFAEWATLHQHYLTTAAEPLPAGHPEASKNTNGKNDESPVSKHESSTVASLAWEKKYLAGREQLRSEGRSRSGMRAALSSLKGLLVEDIENNETSVGPSSRLRARESESRSRHVSDAEEADGDFLKEHVCLRGFLPLSDLYEKSFTTLERLSQVAPLLSEVKSRLRREHTIVDFISNLLIPIASREIATLETRRQLVSTEPSTSEKTSRSRGKEDRDRRRRDTPNSSRKASSSRRGPPREVEEEEEEGEPLETSNSPITSRIPPSSRKGPPAEEGEFLAITKEDDFPPLPSLPKEGRADGKTEGDNEVEGKSPERTGSDILHTFIPNSGASFPLNLLTQGRENGNFSETPSTLSLPSQQNNSNTWSQQVLNDQSLYSIGSSPLSNHVRNDTNGQQQNHEETHPGEELDDELVVFQPGFSLAPSAIPSAENYNLRSQMQSNLSTPGLPQQRESNDLLSSLGLSHNGFTENTGIFGNDWNSPWSGLTGIGANRDPLTSLNSFASDQRLPEHASSLADDGLSLSTALSRSTLDTHVPSRAPHQATQSNFSSIGNTPSASQTGSLSQMFRSDNFNDFWNSVNGGDPLDSSINRNNQNSVNQNTNNLHNWLGGGITAETTNESTLWNNSSFSNLNGLDAAPPVAPPGLFGHSPPAASSNPPPPPGLGSFRSQRNSNNDLTASAFSGNNSQVPSSQQQPQHFDKTNYW